MDENQNPITPATDADTLHRIRQLEDLVSKLKDGLNTAYRERSELLLFLSKVLPSHTAYDEQGDEGFKGLLCAHGPAGQMAWHIADAERKLFDHLPFELAHYDGHSTLEKYNRLREITWQDFATTIAKDPKYGTILRFFCPMRVVLVTIEEFDKLYPMGGGKNGQQVN